MTSGRCCIAFDPRVRRGIVIRCANGFSRTGTVTLRCLAMLVRRGAVALAGSMGAWLVFAHPAHGARWADGKASSQAIP